MVRKDFKLNEVIFKEHESQKWMYSICEGTVEICSGYGTAEERKLATLTEGQYFGELGMIGLMPRTATAVAAADHVVLQLITYDDFEDYLKNHPEHLQPIMSNVSGRIRELTKDLSLITQLTNETLGKKERTGSRGTWFAGQVKKLLDLLKSQESPAAEYTTRHRMTQIAYGTLPPVCRYRAGDVIFHAGDEADCMYEVYEGSVGIYSEYRTSNEKLLTELSVDSVFGEMGILDDMPRSATAVCLTDCCVLVIGKEHFMSFFQNKPLSVLRILQQMCRRLRDLTETYLQVCRALQELPSPEQKNFDEDLAWAKLEYFHESHLYASMYDVSSSAGWSYDYF